MKKSKLEIHPGILYEMRNRKVVVCLTNKSPDRYDKIIVMNIQNGATHHLRENGLWNGNSDSEYDIIRMLPNEPDFETIMNEKAAMTNLESYKRAYLQPQKKWWQFWRKNV